MLNRRQLCVKTIEHETHPIFTYVSPLKVLKRATLTTWEGLLGEEFTGDVKQAWQTLLDYVVAVMVEGSRVFEEEERRCTLIAGGDGNAKVNKCESNLSHRADVKLNE